MNAHTLVDLNDKQREAVTHTEGPLLIVAGAGAGKTKTLTHRIAYLVSRGVRPESILAVTFTNKAAKEMGERLAHLLDVPYRPWQEDGPLIKTFHSFCVWFLRREASFAKRGKLFSIVASDDSRVLIKEAIVGLGLDPKVHEPRKLQYIISTSKNSGHTVERFLRESQSHTASIIASVWRAYEASLARDNAYDFDDLLGETVSILDTQPEVRARYQAYFAYIHIDEYQDTNDVQYRLAELLTNASKNICVVGDADQTIYSWRGANIDNILSFEQEYPDAHVVLLEQNYRSTKTILALANAIIAKNKKRKEKKLFTEGADGSMVDIIEAYTDRREADLVISRIRACIANGVAPSDIAILYRANFQSRAFEEALLSNRILYKVAGLKFFDRKEVKDVLAYIRSAFHPESLTDVRRTINTPARGIGKVTLAKLFAGFQSELPQKTQDKIAMYYKLLERIKSASETLSVSGLVRFVIEESGMLAELMASGTEQDLERIANMEEVATFATRYDSLPKEEGVLKFIEDAALTSDQDSLDEQGAQESRVSLMTVHASKGLEFAYVFVVGLESGLFPSERDGEKQTQDDKEEERRLFYVAVTRARHHLTLSYARCRTIFGQRSITIPSEFISDVPDYLSQWEFDKDVPKAYTGDTEYETYINW